MKTNKSLITIDGPSYVGKSTIAQELARLFGWIYINTGHIYRSVAKLSIDSGVSYEDHDSIVSIAKSLNIEFKNTGNSTRTIVNNMDFTESLHSPEIDSYSSKIATGKRLRKVLNIVMRKFKKKSGVIFEGRDLGTIVFPEALWKFYITASIGIRARRMKKKLIGINPDQVLIDSKLIRMIEELDESDLNREVAPLRKASDAITYDNSDSPSEYQDALILQYYINHSNEIANNSVLLFDKKNQYEK